MHLYFTATSVEYNIERMRRFRTGRARVTTPAIFALDPDE